MDGRQRYGRQGPRYYSDVLIGELSRRAGVSVQAIRFYERKGLLKKPLRTTGGYRTYSERDLEVVRMIRQGQRFSFTLTEIRRILALFAVPDERSGKPRYARGDRACLAEILWIGEGKLASMNEQIDSLTERRQELAGALDGLRRGRNSRRRKSARKPVAD